MYSLSRALGAYDIELLRVIANRWDADVEARDARTASEVLAAAMLIAAKVEAQWASLPDEQRGALQALLGAEGSRMAAPIFNRLYGSIRQMGPDRLLREQPYLAPQSIAEALYYRGLLAQGFADSARGKQAVVYIPTDLAALMPKHQTAYADLAAEPLPNTAEPENIRPADTALVDDLTTLLAACQVEEIVPAEGGLSADVRSAIKPHLLGSASAARAALMVALALELGLLTIGDESDGKLRPAATAARSWLDAPRPAQVRALAEAWLRTAHFNELWHTPSLRPEATGWQNDPLLPRQALVRALNAVPPAGWWRVDELVDAIYEAEPDFMRPDGDYDSWYIRDAQSGEYLRGFEAWEDVDGAVLRFLLVGPLHGLGLVDTAVGGAACRLTAYGRALLGRGEWPTASEGEGAAILLKADGTCLAPRTANRYERFQLARFTDWVSAGDPYTYKLSADGMARARRQGIRGDHVLAFLRRATEGEIPEAVTRQIDLWGQTVSETATISQMIVLRVPEAAALDVILNTPALRRYLGAVLGPTAVAVRAGQWEALSKALRENGITVDVQMT